MATAPTHTNNFVLGAGKLYFDLFDSSGNKTGERYLGDTPAFSLTGGGNTIDLYDSDNPIASLVERVMTEATYSGKIQCNDISLENQALFISGAEDDVTQTATAVTGETISSVQQGRWYQLGVSSTNPTGVRKVSSITVGDGDSTTYIKDTDYYEDTDLARIFIIDGGGISDDTDLSVGYTPTAGTRKRIKSSENAVISGALRFIANNTKGTNRDAYMPKVNIRPDGDFAFKSRSDFASINLAVDVLKSDAAEAIYIDEQTVTS